METIKLWVDNRLDNEIEKPYSAVWDEFKLSSFYKDYVFEPHRTLYDALIMFITFKSGLNASFEQGDIEPLYDYIKKASKESLK